MSMYSIKELEILSGVKAHTIRMWEKRYNLMTPSRTKSNIRTYNDEDLRALMNVVFLKNHGLKISQIAKLNANEILERVLELDGKYHNMNIPIEKFLTPIVEMNDIEIIHQLNHFIIGRGIEKTYEGVLKDVFRKVLVLENAGVISRVQRNFLSNLIKRYLYVAIENLPVPREFKKNVCFLMPTDESIDLRLIFLNYIAHKESHKCFYVGQVSEEQITTKTFSIINPDFVVTTFFAVKDVSIIEKHVCMIRELLPDVRIILSGPSLDSDTIKLPDNTFFVGSSEEFKEVLNSI